MPGTGAWQTGAGAGGHHQGEKQGEQETEGVIWHPQAGQRWTQKPGRLTLIRPWGGESTPPPSTFRAIIACTALSRLFSFESCAINFWRYFRKNRAYRSEVTQHYVIERRLKIWEFSGFVYKTWKMAFCPKNQFWALKVCYLPWF